VIGSGRGIGREIALEFGREGLPLECAYDSSKFAQIGFMQSLANEVKDYNINAILPSATNTRLFRESYPEVDYSMILQPSDVSKAAVFLAGEGADKIKGACIELYNAQNFKPVV
jgi:NAD(P)-dependent dehydrogenase (short-subunit alcohol dehydrogenase family)